MSAVTVALQRAMVARLRDEPACAALFAGRVYDDVPPDAVFPYVSIGELQRLDDGGDGYRGSEIYITLHVWSRGVGAVEARTVCDAVTEALNGFPLDLSPRHRLVEILHQDDRTFRDPDGRTTHGVITLRAQTEPA